MPPRLVNVQYSSTQSMRRCRDVHTQLATSSIRDSSTTNQCGGSHSHCQDSRPNTYYNTTNHAITLHQRSCNYAFSSIDQHPKR